MRALLEGYRLTLARPRLRAAVVRTFAASVLVFLVVFVLSTWGVGRVLSWLGVSEGLSLFVGVIASVVASGVLFLAVASFVAGWFFEDVARRTEEELGGAPPDRTPNRGAMLADSFRRGGRALGLAVLALLSGFVLPVVGPLLIAGWAATLDATAPAFARRGILLREQGRAIRRIPGWPGFVLGAGALSLVPLLNALALPALVVGATILVRSGSEPGAGDEEIGADVGPERLGNGHRAIGP